MLAMGTSWPYSTSVWVSTETLRSREAIFLPARIGCGMDFPSTLLVICVSGNCSAQPLVLADGGNGPMQVRDLR